MEEQYKFTYNKSEETFQYLIDTLKDTIKSWDYFVNWNKVYNNLMDVEINLNILNYLIGKDNLKDELGFLIRKYPEIIKTIPILIASRDENFKILKANNGQVIKFEDEEYDFSGKKELNQRYIEKVIDFVDKTGILDIIKNKKVKNLVDYVFGVEVGLDSNGRKNRSGTSMESLVELFIKYICNKYGYGYISQATPEAIKLKWKLEVKVDKASRRFDFAVFTGEKLFLIETNYYGGGGSKLKATAGEYKTLQDLINKDGYEFIWITDGKGWLTATKPLQETFEHNKYLLNLHMLENKVLEDIIVGNIVV